MRALCKLIHQNPDLSNSWFLELNVFFLLSVEYRNVTTDFLNHISLTLKVQEIGIPLHIQGSVKSFIGKSNGSDTQITFPTRMKNRLKSN